MRADLVDSVTTSDAHECNGVPLLDNPPQVLIHYGNRCIVLSCKNNSERDKLAAAISSKVAGEKGAEE